jgi:3-hydroxyisobutyrate dehydrogenase-like beta-hydroxyacid dehydrogenase
MASAGSAYGFIGLGDMGGPMAANMAAAGLALTVYDKAGTAGRAPAAAAEAQSVATVAAAVDTIYFSLPDGAICMSVAQEVMAAADRRVTTVVDLSTIGPEAAREIAATLAEANIAYMDAPVSGGAAGAKAGTITVMWGGPRDVMEGQHPALEAIAGNIFHVGDDAGQGQTMKLVNNYLSAIALAATSEAMAFGTSQGLDIGTMIEVLNVSTGRNSATLDKFPNRIVTGRYDAGFRTRLMVKDVGLYATNAEKAGTFAELAPVLDDLWRRVDRAMPDSDITEIYKFMGGGDPA